MVNKKAQIQSTLAAIMLIFAVGVVVFLFGDIFYRFFVELSATAGNVTVMNNNATRETLDRAVNLYATSWDYVTLAVMFAVLISLIFLSYMTRVTPFFYWIYILFSLVVVIVTSLLSEVWTTITTQAVYADAVLRYPITNLILGRMFVTITFLVTVILVIAFMFGKGGGNEVR